MIKRDYYLNQIIDKMWDGNIKVITGLRRSGKSTLLFELFYDYLINNNVDSNNIIRIELDQRKYLKYRNPIVLCDTVEKIISNKPNEKYYLFIDEVQLTEIIPDSQSGINVSIYDMLNELKAYSNLDCYVTGSNSKMLSNDIATEFRGRSSQVHVYPLSFEEYYSFKQGNPRDALDEYMQYGGMPRLLLLSKTDDKRKYLTELYNEIYIKDLVEHEGIKREDVLEKLLDYLASQISSLTNPSKIANSINVKAFERIDDGLISRYLNQLENAFLISKAKRYDIKGKAYFDYPNKYYYTDIGLRNARLNFRQNDPGHIMENIIYNELIRLGYFVDIGVVEDRKNGSKRQKEIDFIVNNFDKKIYIQSALQMNEDDKVNAELDSLRLTGDFFKKIVIQNDILTSFYDDNGFFHASLIDFLLGKVQLF